MCIRDRYLIQQTNESIEIYYITAGYDTTTFKF
jgi:hypothetical protein